MRLIFAASLIIAVNICKAQEMKVSDYITNERDGHAYKLMYKAETWEIAKETCEKEGAKLAVPKSKEQFLFLQQMVRKMHYPSIIGAKYQYLVFLGINNKEDYKIWKNIDGEDIKSTGFHEWASSYAEEARPDPAEPHCVGIDAVNPGLREFWCNLAQPYICERMTEKKTSGE